MESWRKVWREGIVLQLSTQGLAALERALIEDDERLVQGATTMPPPLQCMQECPVEGACPVGFSAWQGDGRETVGDVEDFFAKVCFEADIKLGEPAACRWFLNWFDDTPRDEVRRLLLAEVQRELTLRRGKDPEAAQPVADETAAA